MIGLSSVWATWGPVVHVILSAAIGAGIYLWGYAQGVKHTKQRWSDAVQRAEQQREFIKYRNETLRQ